MKKQPKHDPKYVAQWQKLTKAIYSSRPTIRPDYVVGFYRYMARVEAMEKVLIKKGIITQAEIEAAELPIIKAMQKDFKRL